MANKAQLGDKVIVTNPKLADIFEHCFTVIESPCCPSALDNIPECIWVKSDDINYVTFWLAHSSYEIVKQTKSESSVLCQDCGGTGKVVLFTSIVTCRCCNG